jgi:peptidoglycan/xylan/chitin deacetylase (PgdA/CDA1 family)
MATKWLHLNPLVSAALAAAAALVALCACVSQRHTIVSPTAATGSTSTSSAPLVAALPGDAPGSGPVPVQEDDCPLRMPTSLPDRQIVVPILMYHRIDYVDASTPAITRRLTVSPEDFARQLRWLKRNNYRTITQKELWDALMCGRRLGRKPVLITLDDGYRDVYTKASPIIERLGMRATAYVITGRISRSSSFLKWEQLPKLERRGVEVASHTISHTAGLTSLSDRDALRQLVASRRILERKLDHRVPWFAYPFGDYDARIVRLARKAGYLLATTTVWGARQSASQPLELTRLRVLDSTHVSGLASMLASTT